MTKWLIPKKTTKPNQNNKIRGKWKWQQCTVHYRWSSKWTENWHFVSSIKISHRDWNEDMWSYFKSIYSGINMCMEGRKWKQENYWGLPGLYLSVTWFQPHANGSMLTLTNVTTNIWEKRISWITKVRGIHSFRIMNVWTKFNSNTSNSFWGFSALNNRPTLLQSQPASIPKKYQGLPLHINIHK